MKKFLLLTVIVLGFALTLAACGGGGAPTSIKVNMTDFGYDPAVITVAAGQEITMTITNSGAVDHEFVIFNAGEDVSVPFSEDDEAKIYWEIEVMPGETQTVTFTAPAAGEYVVSCGVAGHYEAGMIAKLISK
jgi:uncharacterized cupredoxin-like copper-binding protein